jgi:hypothetical protein
METEALAWLLRGSHAIWMLVARHLLTVRFICRLWLISLGLIALPLGGHVLHSAAHNQQSSSIDWGKSNIFSVRMPWIALPTGQHYTAASYESGTAARA